MGGDHSQKLLPWRGIRSSPGRSKPPAHCEINTVTENDRRESRGAPLRSVSQILTLSYRLPGSFLKSRGGSLLESTEARWSGLPVLVFIFLPLTTIVYAWELNSGMPTAGINLLWLLIAVIIDLGGLGGGAHRQSRR